MPLNFTFKIINHLLNQVTRCSFFACHRGAETVNLNAHTSNSWLGIWKPQHYVIIIVSYSKGKYFAAAVTDVIMLALSYKGSSCSVVQEKHKCTYMETQGISLFFHTYIQYYVIRI